MTSTLTYRLKRFDDADKALNAPDGSRFYEYNISEVQKHTLLGYKDNPIISQVMQGQMTVESELDELKQEYKGLNFFLPHFKDAEFNARVENLGELIDPVDFLKKKGIHFPDNILTLGVYFTALTFAACNLAAEIGPLESWSQDQIETLRVYFPAALSAAFTFTVGLATTISCRSPNINPLDETKYLDSKIKELI